MARRRAEAAFEGIGDRHRLGLGVVEHQIGVERLIAARRFRQAAAGRGGARRVGHHVGAPFAPSGGDLERDAHQADLAFAVAHGAEGAGAEGHAIRGEESAGRPAAGVGGQRQRLLHARGQRRFARDLDRHRHEQLVDQRPGPVVGDQLGRHRRAPMVERGAGEDQHRHVAAARLVERCRAPAPPSQRAAGEDGMEEVGRSGDGQCAPAVASSSSTSSRAQRTK